MGEKIRTHRDLKVYRKAFDAAMQIFELLRGNGAKLTTCGLSF